MNDFSAEIQVKKIERSPLGPSVIGEEINKGSHARIHKLKKLIGGVPYVVKIGEWKEYDPIITKLLPLRLNRESVDAFLTKAFGNKNMGIYPTPEFIHRTFDEEYRLIKNYFSPYEEDSQKPDKANPRKELLLGLRNPNSDFYKRVHGLLGDETLIAKIADVFEKHEKDNFLKQENVVIGLPRDISVEEINRRKAAGKKIPTTYYLFQEEVGGDVVSLGNINKEDLSSRPEIIEKLLTFALLQKKMYEDTGKLIDTRPTEIAKHPTEWFQKTDNILIDRNTNQLFFVDTRWIWDRKTRFIGDKGLNLIDSLARKSVDRAIKKYAGFLF